MEYRKLGRSGLKVSRLCLGTMLFGSRTDVATAERVLAEAKAAGVNFLDTADVYNLGRSEEIIGHAIAGERDDWVIASKVGNPMGEGLQHRGLSRRWVLAACEGSLRRLGVDHLDIYYLHREDPDTPLEETVGALADLVRAGKVRYLGVSNFRSWRIAELCRLCREAGIDAPIASQPYYNAMNRMPEVEQLPAAAFFGLGVVPYSPMARGVLSGKYDPGAPPPPDSRAGVKDKRMMETEWRPESLRIAQQIKKHAEAHGTTAGRFAVAWVLNNRFVTAVVAGPRTLEQWRDYLAALDYGFTAEDEALVDSLVPPGHPSTPGFVDPAYPLEGRPTWTAKAQ